MRSVLSFAILSVLCSACSSDSEPVAAEEQKIVPSTNLAGYWKFDESSGTTAADASGNGLTGILNSTPTWGAGKVNNGLSFDGTDYVEVGAIPSITGASRVTLAAWIKRATTGAKVVLGKHTSTSEFAIKALQDGQLYFRTSRGVTTYGRVLLNDTNWHHVALVFDGTLSGNANRLKGFVDGVQRTLTFSGTVSNITTTNTTPFRIGRTNNDYSNGQIDEVTLYARALTGAEIVQLRDNGSVAPDTQAPTVPSGLGFTSTQTSIALGWTASTDNVAVTSYRVFRNGSEITTTTGTSYTDNGRTPGTSYTYTVSARDGAGNESAQSAPLTASTQAAGDTTPPTVSVTAPIVGSSVSGQATLTANASDNVAVANVQFFVDGAPLGTPDTSSPYTAAWNTATASNGSHVVTARATDTSSNATTSAPVTVTVNNATVDTQAPSVPQGLGGTPSSSSVSLSWQASTDNVGVTGYRVYRDALLRGTSTGTSFSDTGLTPQTTYRYSVSAFDAANNESAQSGAVSVTTSAAPSGGLSIAVHSSGRYLVNGSGQPVLLNSVAAWSLLAQLDQAGTLQFLDNCRAFGVNAIRVNLVEAYFSNAAQFSGINAFGQAPWTGGAFTSSLNQPYWDHVKWVLERAAERGIYVFALPAYLGNNGGGEGWWTARMKPAGATNMQNYGAALGAQLNAHPNVIVAIGGDYWPGFDNSPSSSANVAIQNAMVTGIMSTDRAGRIYTAHWSGGTNSSDAPESWLKLNLQYDIYNGYATAGMSLAAWNASPARPTFFGEGIYVRNTGLHPSNADVRGQYWRALMYGASGQETGDEAIWAFDARTSYQPTERWRNHLADAYWTHLSRVPQVLGSRPWFRRVPDSSHTVVTAGYGSAGTTGFCPASATPEGDLLTAYCAGTATLTVNRAKFTSAINASWIDPTSGRVTPIVTNGANSGSSAWTTPATNDAGDRDWILVVEKAQ